MGERAEVVVVGGGIMGCTVALELADAGVDVLLLERDGLAEATSNAGAGFVALWGGMGLPTWGADEVKLERHGLELYRALAEEHDFGYKNNGTMWVAASPEAWEWVGGIATTPLMTTEVLDGDDVARLTGVTDPTAVHGGVFQPDGCQLRAGDATRAIAARVERAGGRIQARRPVTRLRCARDRIVAVETPWGDIDTEQVVLAAGAWANDLLRPLGSWLPMVPLVASRITTGPLGIPPRMPAMMWVEYAGLWIREEQGGLVWGATYSADPHFRFATTTPPSRFDQLPLDGIDEVRALARRAATAIPVLGRPMSVTVAHGAPCFTPDQVGLVGPVPGIDGLWVTAGCNEAGITRGPGYARVLRELLTTGSSSMVDADRLRVDRFGEEYRDVAAIAVAMKQRASVHADDGSLPVA